MNHLVILLTYDFISFGPDFTFRALFLILLETNLPNNHLRMNNGTDMSENRDDMNKEKPT
jgi:hypothetical protein